MKDRPQMKGRLQTDKKTALDAINSTSPPHSGNLPVTWGLKSLISLVTFLCLSALAYAQNAETDHFVLKITINAPLFVFESFTFYTEDTNYDIDWDNDQIFESADTGVSGSQSHTFTTLGEYTIRFRNLNDVYINDETDKGQYTSIEQWGTAVWHADMSNAFQGASRLTMTATDTPDMSAVTNMNNMFDGATSFNGDLSEWNTALVTDMSYMFSDADGFNGDLSEWNIASVTNMYGMFLGASAFNQDLSKWNTAKVTDMLVMFSGATKFNGDISGWNIEAVTNMQRMFSGATSFNGDLSGWNTASVTNMYSMFNGATKFNGDISGWNTESVTNMHGMFQDATSFDQNIGGWNTAKVTNTDYMFQNATSFDQNIGGWNTAKVTNMDYMFKNATSFDQNIGGWNTAKVTNMDYMFQNATSFDQNIGGWNTTKVTNMKYMFNGATSFNGDISGWNTASLTHMYGMFNGATSFDKDIGGWNIAKVRGMSSVFRKATSFNQDLSEWNTAKVTDMNGMFREATSFDQDIGGWNVEAVTTMQRMFYGVTLSFKNYDSLLVGWNRQNLRPSVVFGGGNSSYMSTQAQTARENMTTSDRWTITDEGRRTRNQAPTDIFLSSENIAENAGVNAVVGMLSNTDTGGMYTYTLVDGDGDADNGSFNILGTTLRLTASADYETLAIIPPQTTRSRANYSVQINVSDGTHDFSKGFTISLDDVNEAPTASDTTFVVAENSTNGIAVGTVLATDPDPVQNPSYTLRPNVNSTLTYAITGGNTGNVFAIDPTTGAITVAGALDYETTPSYSLVVTVTDGGSTSRLSDTATLTITVTDVANESNNAPVFAEGAVATVSYAENGPTAVTTVIATDADARQTVTFTLTGGADAGQFSITPAGELTFNIAPDYENPIDVGTDNIYEVIITASDDDTPALTATQTLTITVTDVEVEYLFSASQRTFTPLIDATAVTNIKRDDALSLSLSVGFDFTFYGTTYSTLKASSNGFLTFNPTHTDPRIYENEIAGTELTHAIMPFWDDLNGGVNGAQASYKVTGSSPNRVYTFEWLNFGRFGTTGQISLQVSLHETSNVIELVYGPGALTADTRSVSASIGIKGVATDFFSLAGRGTSPMRSSGGNDIIASKPSDGQVYQFALTPPLSVTNVAPVITSNGGGTVAAVAVAENQTEVTTVTVTDADTGQTVSFTLTGGVDEGLFSITTAGELTFNTAPDYENPGSATGSNIYTVAVTATDNGTPPMTAMQALTITVTDDVSETNTHTPVFEGGATATVSYAENATTVVTTVVATDADAGQTLTLMLSGADEGLFSITTAGELTFNTAPDFEMPTDTGMNNVYEVTVTATDNGTPAMTATQTLTITVTGVNDNPPVFTSGADVNVSEGTTVVTTVVATDADAGQTVTLMLSGADEGLFSITTAGELRFNTVPDYENPVDMGGNNVYEVTVTATDNGTPAMIATQTLTITVTGVNDNPPVFTSGADVNVSEGTTVVTTVVATDADAGQTVTLMLSGADEGLFSIITAGELRFNTVPDYENPVDMGGNNVYEVTVTATDNGTPAMTATQTLTITVTDEVDGGVGPTLGLEAFTGVEVYPNPTGAVLHISGVEGNAHYTLSGIDGKMVKRGKLKADKADHSVAIPSLNKGIYVLQLITGKGSVTRKIVKE